MTQIADLTNMVSQAQRIVVFTGAGISTESGIPDFRSPGGVWTKMNPIMFADFVASREQRREAWNRVFANSAGWVGAAPNSGHHAITRLVELGKARSVITQNVDNLHQDAGTPTQAVIELHGNASYATCLECATRYDLDGLKPRWQADEDITCTQCDGLIKTATISFGQPMPQDKMRRSVDESRQSDLFLVLGSSLVVQPANTLPLIAKQAGAELVIVNREPTPLDGYADLVLNTGIGDVMREVMFAIEEPSLN